MSYDGIDSVVRKRGLFMCQIENILLQKLKGSMWGDARDFNIETGDVIKYHPPPPPARQGAEENSRYSESNIRGTRTIARHRQKPGGPV
jgi:hypothetical protein